MATEITMPQLGESVVDGTVGEWLKQVGDPVEEFEPIVRVSTDKVDSEIPASADGVLLEIYVAEGETVDAGIVLGVIGEAGEKVGAQPGNQDTGESASAAIPDPLPSHAVPVSTSPSHNGNAHDVGHVTPVVARMAREHNIDLSRITGTGRDGRIRKKDVLNYLNNQDAPHTATEDLAPWEIPGSGDLFKPSVDYGDVPSQENINAPKSTTEQTPAPQRPRLSQTAPAPQGIPGELVKLSSMRQSIAKHMVDSKFTAPHVTTVMEVDLQAVSEHRRAHKADFAKQGVKLTFTPYFVMAIAKALQDVPIMNARWTDEGLFYNHRQHIGMAAAIDDGLIVPVIKNASDFNLMGLARAVNDLAERARNRQLTADEVQGGTFTLTNHGVSGSLLATPIINQPQSGILGVGMIEKRVKVIDDAIAIRPCSFLSLTFDHRVADGATADHFLMGIKSYLENWS